MIKAKKLVRRNKKLLYLLITLLSIFYCIKLLSSSSSHQITIFHNLNNINSKDISTTKQTRFTIEQLKELFNFLFKNEVFLMDIETLTGIQFKNLTEFSKLNKNSFYEVNTFTKIKSYFINKKKSNIQLSFGALVKSYFRIIQVFFLAYII